MSSYYPEYTLFNNGPHFPINEAVRSFGGDGPLEKTTLLLDLRFIAFALQSFFLPLYSQKGLLMFPGFSLCVSCPLFFNGGLFGRLTKTYVHLSRSARRWRFFPRETPYLGWHWANITCTVLNGEVNRLAFSANGGNKETFKIGLFYSFAFTFIILQYWLI